MKKSVIFSMIFAVTTVVLAVICFNLGNKLEKAESNSILQDEQNKKEEENKKLSAEVSTLTTEVGQKEESIKELETQIAGLEEQISKINNVVSDNEKEVLLQQKATLEAQKEVLENEKAQLMSQIAELQQTIETNENTFLVVYVDDGGAVYCENVVKNENVVNVPTPAAKTGYDVEWSRDGNNITEDTVIVAEYTAKTYNITYILGRPLDGFYNLCGAHQYNDDNEVELYGITYVLNFNTNTVTSVYDPMLENSVENYPISDNHFTINNETYMINRDFKVVYAVVGDNNVIAKPAFAELPTTIKYGETMVLNYFAEDYINYVNRDGTASDGSDFGRRFPYTWVIYGADSITYDTSSVEANTKMYIRATGDLLIFVEYQREPS